MNQIVGNGYRFAWKVHVLQVRIAFRLPLLQSAIPPVKSGCVIWPYYAVDVTPSARPKVVPSRDWSS